MFSKYQISNLNITPRTLTFSVKQQKLTNLFENILYNKNENENEIENENENENNEL